MFWHLYCSLVERGLHASLSSIVDVKYFMSQCVIIFKLESCLKCAISHYFKNYFPEKIKNINY